MGVRNQSSLSTANHNATFFSINTARTFSVVIRMPMVLTPSYASGFTIEFAIAYIALATDSVLDVALSRLSSPTLTGLRFIGSGCIPFTVTITSSGLTTLVNVKHLFSE